MNADLYGCFSVPTGAQSRQTGVNTNCNWAGTSWNQSTGTSGSQREAEDTDSNIPTQAYTLDPQQCCTVGM